MHRGSGRKRILFVDDEPNIRATLPPVIEQSGFEVRTVGSVPDALFEINSYEFDVLIADLNISEEGDGFLVVSAMRHLQPSCINLILTGYPALETALQAIRNQVDDYLIKPADVDLIISTIRDKLENRRAKPSTALKRLPALLKENFAQIPARLLPAMRQDPKLASVSLTDDDRVQPVCKILRAVLEQSGLENENSNAEPAERLALEYGRQRKKQGYTVPMILVDFHLLRQVIYDLVQSEIITTDMAALVVDLKKLENRLALVVEKSLEPFARARRASATVH